MLDPAALQDLFNPILTAARVLLVDMGNATAVNATLATAQAAADAANATVAADHKALTAAITAFEAAADALK